MFIKDKITGNVEEIDESLLPEVAKQDNIQVPEKDYAFESNRGTRYTVPASGLKEAVNLNHRYVPSTELEKEAIQAKYGNQPGLASALGAAKGLTLGIAPLILDKTGLLSEKEQLNISEANPEWSTGSEILGAALPVVLSGGTAAAAKGGAKGVGWLASKAPTAAIAKMAARQGTRAAENVTSNLAKKVIQYGLEGTLEGAAIGGINAITEEAMGDKDFNAEAVLAKAGMGAAIGSSVGGLIGAGAYTLNRAAKGVQKKAYSTIVNKIEGDEAFKKTVSDKIANGNDMDEALLALKDPEMQEIKALFPEAPVSKGMESAFKPVKQFENYLFDRPDAIGEGIRKTAKDVDEFVEKEVNNIWSGWKEAKPEEAADLMKKTFFAKINAPRESGRAFYNELMSNIGSAPVPQKLKQFTVDTIKSSDAYRIGSQGTEAKKLISILESPDELTLQQAKYLTSEIDSSLNSLKIQGKASSAESQLLGDLRDLTREMQDSAIKKAMKAKGGNKAAEKVIKGLEAANKDYRQSYKAVQELADTLGIKAKHPEAMLDALESMDNKTLLNKFMNLKKSDKALKVLKEYPEIGKLVLANKQAELITKSLDKDGNILYGSLAKKIQGMDADEKLLYFGMNPKKEKEFMALVKLYDKRPKTLNPSGTDIRKEVRDMLNPVAITQNWALGQVYKGGDSYIGKLVNKVLPGLSGIEAAANSQKNTIASSVSGFFKSAIPAITVGSLATKSDKDVQKISKEYNKFLEYPEKSLETFKANNRDLYVAAPKIAQAMEAKMIAGINFLQSKMPERSSDYINQVRQPSRAELNDFASYAEAIEKPQKVMESIKSGYINPKQIEALKAVYPKIYESLVAEVMAKIPKVMSKSQRNQLQMLLGAKISPAMSKTGFALLQGQSQDQGISQLQQSVIKPTAGAMKELNQAGRAQGSVDNIINRRV